MEVARSSVLKCANCCQFMDTKVIRFKMVRSDHYGSVFLKLFVGKLLQVLIVTRQFKNNNSRLCKAIG